MFHPLQSFVMAHLDLLRGRLHFPRGRIGEAIQFEDGTYTVFRQVQVDHAAGPPQAQFRVRFHLKAMPPWLNRLFSWLPVPFIVGLPGFCGKLWLLNPATGDFRGLYAWATVEAAERYAHSFAMRFMTRRAVPGSISYTVLVLEAEPNG